MERTDPMRKHLVLLFALVLGLVVAAPASATVTHLPFTTEDHLVSAVDGTTTVDGAGNIHVRGSVWQMQVVSDSPYLAGDVTVVINYNLDPVTMTGTMWGTSTQLPDAFDGGFTTHWTGTFTGDAAVWTGRGVGQGFGELAGMQMRYTVAWAPFGDVMDGFLFTPGR